MPDDLLREALELTASDSDAARSDVDESLLSARFAAEFVAESESLEGYESYACDVLNAVRDAALA